MFIGTSYELSINRDYNRRQVMHSEMFLKVCLGFTTVPAETAFVLVLFMAQLVIAKIRAVVLDGFAVAGSDHPVQ